MQVEKAIGNNLKQQTNGWIFDVESFLATNLFSM